MRVLFAIPILAACLGVISSALGIGGKSLRLMAFGVIPILAACAPSPPVVVNIPPSPPADIREACPLLALDETDLFQLAVTLASAYGECRSAAMFNDGAWRELSTLR